VAISIHLFDKNIGILLVLFPWLIVEWLALWIKVIPYFIKNCYSMWGGIMKAKSCLLWLIISFPAPVFAGSDGIMFHCEIDKEWIDLFFDIDRVAHYVHSKDYVIDLALDNRRDTNLFKMSSVPLVGGGQVNRHQ
jgi:ABC-type antimicrobial peptide transport system permease subunit